MGVIHAAFNVAVTILYAKSWLRRVRNQHSHGVAFGVAGGALAWVGGYLGGYLSFNLGIGVGDDGLRPDINLARRETGGLADRQ